MSALGSLSDQPDDGQEAIVALLKQALDARAERLRRAVDDEVLQYACAALQELHDIHRAEPTEALWRAIGNMHNAITHLRGLVERQPPDEQELEAIVARHLEP